MKENIKEFARAVLLAIVMILLALLLAENMPVLSRIMGVGHADESPFSALKSGEVTFQMNRLDSVRAFWARFYGEVLPYRESGEEDLQDSIARCVLSYLKYKMKRLDTVILYAGREPGDETHLICHVFPVDEPTYARMCVGIGMVFVSADEEKYTLTCGPKPQLLDPTRESVAGGGDAS